MATKKKTARKKPAAAKREYVIVRCNNAGVHAGYLKSMTATHVVLEDSRRIWYWSGAASLSEIAVYGLNPAKSSASKIAAKVSSVRLRDGDICEVIACTEEGRASVDGAPVWRA
jgi:hypothetical protein